MNLVNRRLTHHYAWLSTTSDIGQKNPSVSILNRADYERDSPTLSYIVFKISFDLCEEFLVRFHYNCRNDIHSGNSIMIDWCFSMENKFLLCWKYSAYYLMREAKHCHYPSSRLISLRGPRYTQLETLTLNFEVFLVTVNNMCFQYTDWMFQIYKLIVHWMT